MLSRRTFLATSLGLLLQPQLVLGKRAPEIKHMGPHSLVRQEWPPAIAPDFVSIVDRGYGLLSDQSGRLAIVEFKREEGPLVVGELAGIGKKIVDLVTTQHRAYAIVYQETATESQFSLVVISITPAQDPTVLFRMPLSFLSEPSCLAVSQDIVAIAGIAHGGENQVQIYNLSSRRRGGEANTNTPAATVSCESAVGHLDFQDRQLVILQPGTSTIIDVYSLLNSGNPEKVAKLQLDGNYSVMARLKDVLAVAGQAADKKIYAQLVALRPIPHVVSKKLLPVTEILDMSIQRGQLLVLANQANRQTVLPVNFDKSLAMTLAEPVLLRAGTNGAASKARIVAREKEAYVASDWGGVHVLSITKTGWQYLYSHTIPRLPAAGVAISGTRAVVTGADIKVYNIAQPQHPVLISVTEVGMVIRAVATVGERFMVLTKDTLTLRSIDKPGEVLSLGKVNGQALAYDDVHKLAYVLAGKEQNSTTVYPVLVKDSLSLQPSFVVSGLFRHGSARNGRLLLHGLNNLAIFDTESGDTLLASRTFANFAIRDIELLGDSAVITVVDSNSKGFLLVINTLVSDLPIIGTVDLPTDAVALAVSGNCALVIGRGSAGQDIASVIDLSSSASPKVMSSFPVLEAAAAVEIKGQLAVVAGRGLEIVSLS